MSTRKHDQHSVASALKDLAAELGKPSLTGLDMQINRPGLKDAVYREFGSLPKALAAAGLSPFGGKTQDKAPQKLLRQYQKLCAKVEPIQGHFRHVLDLDEMFRRAGNPATLKLSAQPDTHAKFVDRPAFNAYTKFLRYWKPHVHLIMGDFVDCEGLSHWPSDDLAPRRIVPEMKLARGLLEELVNATPDCSARLFLTGNHEAWIDQAFTQMPELFEGLAELDIELSLNTLLGLPKFGYELFPLNHMVKIGKAHFTHGIYTGEHHASKHLKKLKCNIYYGHLHDTQEHNETSMEGDLESASLGCLCRKDARFLKGKPNNWVHGHGIFEFFQDGSYTVLKPKIVSGRFAFNGHVFDGNEP